MGSESDWVSKLGGGFLLFACFGFTFVFLFDRILAVFSEGACLRLNPTIPVMVSGSGTLVKTPTPNFLKKGAAFAKLIYFFGSCRIHPTYKAIVD